MSEAARNSDHNRHRVLIVDDHPIVREGLELLLSQQEDLVVCGQAEDATKALDLIKTTQPDVAIIDISLPSSNGLELIRQVKTTEPSVRILVSSMYDETLYAERALHAGAMGYINKQESTRKIIDAIHRILEDRIYLSDKMFDRLVHRLVGTTATLSETSVDTLSDRELEVFGLIGKGLKTAEIADQMNLSVKTIETYRQRIRQKLSLKSGAALSQRAAQWVLEGA